MVDTYIERYREGPVCAAMDDTKLKKTSKKIKTAFRVHLVARCRKDARLCFPALPGGRRKYGQEKFRPEEVRKDESIPWRKAPVFLGGRRRTIRYKELRKVLWQGGAGMRLLRPIVIAPNLTNARLIPKPTIVSLRTCSRPMWMGP